jgi:CHAD domain-containing protein
MTHLIPKDNPHASSSRVHKLRIAIRRRRAVLWILERSLPGVQAQKLDKHLRKFGKLLGSIRELDVAIKDSKKYGLDASALESKRKRRRRAALQYMNKHRRRRLLHEMAAVLAAIRSHKRLDLNASLGDVRLRLSCWQNRRPSGATELHRFRIAVKKMRYVLDALGKSVEPLAAIQKLLGRAHDLETLQRFVGPRRMLMREQSALSSKAVRLAKPGLQQIERTLNVSYA